MRVACNIQPILKKQKTGIGKAAQEISKRLASESTRVFLEAFGKLPAVEEQIKGIYPENTHLCVFSGMKDKTYQILWAALPVPYRLFFKESADVRIFFNYYVPPGVGSKTATFIHDMSIRAFPETMNWKTRIFLSLTLKRSVKRADIIFTISEFSKSEIIKYLGVEKERIFVIPLGIDHLLYHDRYTQEEKNIACKKLGVDRPYYLYVGTLEPRKNLLALIKAYAIIKENKGNSSLLVIVGQRGWKYGDVYEIIRACGLENDVVFTGYLPEAELPLLMGNALAFVFPSFYEGFGLPPLEAMACGVPVIVSAEASLPEVVGDAGILVNPYDPGDIAEAMIRVADDGKVRGQYAREGAARAKEFTWEKATQAIWTALGSVINEE